MENKKRPDTWSKRLVVDTYQDIRRAEMRFSPHRLKAPENILAINLVDVLEVPYEYFFIDDDNQGKKNTVPVDIPFEFAIFSRQKDALEWLRLICEMRMRGFTIDGLRLIADIAQKHMEEMKSKKKPQP